MNFFFFVLSSLLLVSRTEALLSQVPTPIPTQVSDLPPQQFQKEIPLTELSRLDFLLEATTKNLANQKKLREGLIAYQQVEKLYLKAPENKELLFRLVKTAHQLLSTIQENHLEEVFSADFIKELTLLSQIAHKKGMPKQ